LTKCGILRVVKQNDSVGLNALVWTTSAFRLVWRPVVSVLPMIVLEQIKARFNNIHMYIYYSRQILSPFLSFGKQNVNTLTPFSPLN
jgi:hypothetical protein